MKEIPEIVKDALDRRRSSAWTPGGKIAALVAAVQAFLSLIRGLEEVESILLGTPIVFVIYWVFFSLMVWLWRKFRARP